MGVSLLIIWIYLQTLEDTFFFFLFGAQIPAET